jgi:hypothetical protein
MKLCLCYPYNKYRGEYLPYAPLGLAYLAGTNISKWHDVFILDGLKEKLKNSIDLVEKIISEKPDIVGYRHLLFKLKKLIE